MPITYVAMTSIDPRILDRELKKGSAELIILSIIEPRARHGYEISKLIETRSAGQLKFHVASLYPLLYRLEEREWIESEWGFSENNRKAKFYKLTPDGRKQLIEERSNWERLSTAVNLVLKTT